MPGVPSAPPDDDAGGFVQSTTATLKKRFERYEDKPLVRLGMGIFERDRHISGTVAGSAIAFRLFLFFVPLLLFVVGISGFVSTLISADDVNERAGLTGSMAEQIETALSQPAQTRWAAIIIGFFGLLTAGYSLTKVMVAAGVAGWQLQARPKASPKLIGALVGVISGVGLVALIINRIRADAGVGVASISFLAAFWIYLVAWLVAFRVMPRATSDPGALIPGAAIVALTMTGMQAISQLYIPDRMSRASELYGAFGATIVTLGWFFILGRTIVLAIVCNAVIHERFGSITNFVFSWPIIRLFRRVRIVRRVFDLDEQDATEVTHS
ncbi:MAG: hypothetical protein K0S92_1201 [Desertimonas sp.]|nr:hypothetical protein [Desertimonas sp.]